MTKGRLEAFSDGVFAIAITLLVIDLRPPETDGATTLAEALWDLWPNYLAYLLSFLVIGVMWVNHHRVLDGVLVVDGPLLLFNLHLLLWVVVVPFPTAVVADHLRDGGADASTAVALYGGVLFCSAVAWTALNAWITHDDRLIGRALPRDVVVKQRLRFGMGLAVYAVAFALSWVSTAMALGLHAVMALYYAFDQAQIGIVDAAGD